MTRGALRGTSPVLSIAMACALSLLGHAVPGLAASAPADGEPERPPSDAENATDLRGFLKGVLGVRGTRGHIKAKSVKWRDFPPATNAEASLHIAQDGDWFLDNLRGAQCGGRMTGTANILFGGPQRKFDFKAKWTGVRLEEVTRYINRAVTPGILNANAEILATSTGKEGLSGSVTPPLRNGDLAKPPMVLSGEVTLSLTNGNLGRFPMVLKALSLLSFPGIEKEEIENADARMTLTPRAIVFQDLSLSSTDGAFRLVAERLGSIGYDGSLNVYFRPVIESKFLVRVPAAGELVNKVIDDIQQRAMRIHVTGDIANPRFLWGALKMRRN